MITNYIKTINEDVANVEVTFDHGSYCITWDIHYSPTMIRLSILTDWDGRDWWERVGSVHGYKEDVVKINEETVEKYIEQMKLKIKLEKL